MGVSTEIAWCDSTWNPWEGCTKVSPGCANCYAEARNVRFTGGANWGKGSPRRRTSPANWKQPIKWNNTAVCNECWERSNIAAVAGNLGKCPVCHKDAMRKPRVFCASLADWLDDEVPASWLFDLVTLIHKTPCLDWLLLTKRPENWSRRLRAAAAQCTIDPLDITDRIYAWLEGSRIWNNVWIGTSVEDQARANERIPLLLDIPARIRFLSCEPLLGPVSIPEALPWKIGSEGKPAGIHWVICGGESGPNARPMDPAWARSLRDQCAAAGVAYLFKQWGAWMPVIPGAVTPDQAKSKRFGMFDLDGEWREGVWSTIDDASRGNRAGCLAMVGKHAAGRLLDGVEHNGFPSRPT